MLGEINVKHIHKPMLRESQMMCYVDKKWVKVFITPLNLKLFIRCTPKFYFILIIHLNLFIHPTHAPFCPITPIVSTRA